MYKIIGADQKEYGPISADQIRQWITEGRINGNTNIQAEGTGVWKRAAEFPEFAAGVPVAPPSLHTAPITMAPVPAPARTNQLALWAMISGVISLVCCQILGPVSIILGAVALSKMKQDPQRTGSGFAIAGIVLGIISLILVVVGIWMMMAFPQYLMNLQSQFPH